MDSDRLLLGVVVEDNHPQQTAGPVSTDDEDLGGPKSVRKRIRDARGYADCSSVGPRLRRWASRSMPGSWAARRKRCRRLRHPRKRGTPLVGSRERRSNEQLVGLRCGLGHPERSVSRAAHCCRQRHSRCDAHRRVPDSFWDDGGRDDASARDPRPPRGSTRGDFGPDGMSCGMRPLTRSRIRSSADRVTRSA